MKLETNEILATLLKDYDKFHQSITYNLKPENLYEPIRYMMTLGGKRIRPLLLLTACRAAGGEAKNFLSQAYAIELFHNFTLVHDDIMDAAELRRGKPAVHKKYGINSGILSGDAMMFYAQFFLMESLSASVQAQIFPIFNKAAIRIIEGQQKDMDFESRSDVTYSEYLEMIRDKTSVLLAAALQIGALLASAPSDTAEPLYEAGIKLGLAFQIKDDILDALGDDRFGKVKGGDIMNNKKTLLYLKALELASPSDKNKLIDLAHETDLEKKVNLTIELFHNAGALDFAEAESEKYFTEALDIFEKLDLEPIGKIILAELAKSIHQRSF